MIVWLLEMYCFEDAKSPPKSQLTTYNLEVVNQMDKYGTIFYTASIPN
jgi:hypothetical protein